MILRRWLASLRTRLGSAAAEREIDEELRTHLEMAVEENRAQGMSEREATRAARRALGVSTSIKEARRQADSLYWLDTLQQDLRYGGRVLGRSPAVHRRGGPHPGTRRRHDHGGVRHRRQRAAERGSVRRGAEAGGSETGSDRPAAVRASRRRWWRAGATSGRCSKALKRTTAWSGSSPAAASRRRCGARGYRRASSCSSASRPSTGARSAPNEAASPVAIISHATWRTRFGGDVDIVGQPLRFSDGDLTIVGVMPASFRFPRPCH